MLLDDVSVDTVDVIAVKVVDEDLDAAIESGKSMGEPHLRRAVHEYLSHYHSERNHQGLDNRLIESLPIDPLPEGPVQRRDRLGGMLSYYYREAA